MHILHQQTAKYCIYTCRTIVHCYSNTIYVNKNGLILGTAYENANNRIHIYHPHVWEGNVSVTSVYSSNTLFSSNSGAVVLKSSNDLCFHGKGSQDFCWPGAGVYLWTCYTSMFAYFQGKKSQFISKLIEWIEENKFGQVIILAGSFAHERVDSQLTGYEAFV